MGRVGRKIQKLDVTDQYRKAYEQNTSLKTISDLWENTKVLKLLAHDILEDMK